MPQSLHILSAHIIFSTKERRLWLTINIRERVWAYQSRLLQNLACNSITIGGVGDHVHVLCNLTKKFATAKVLEIVKKIHPNLLRRWIRASATFTGRMATDSSA